MLSEQAGMWDPQPTSNHGSPLPQPPHTNPRNPHLASAAPAKRITFYKSGDCKFGGIRMAVHKRSFKCFDALLDDLSQKMPLPFGVRTVTTPRGTHTIKHLEQLQDGGCYLCSDQRQAKPINMDLASKRPNIWHHHNQRPYPPETAVSTPSDHLPYRKRRILLVKNREPGVRRSLVFSRSSARSLKAFLDEASEVMQFHVRKLYTAEGRRIDNVQSLMTCPAVLVCAGRESFSPQLVNFMRKTSEEKLPGLRTPGNGARSPAAQGARSPIHGAQSRASEYSDGHESKKNVNFGLETKKSIIHPRSDSSNRSTRFSLSSEKSYSQSKPGIINDDIEKRVLVNKDGSLSVEMRVRFRLQNEETLQWSTQIQKSPSLAKECCPLSQAQVQYLQYGQSESCSDPDSISFDPECVDDSSQHPQHVTEGNHCPCCYQRHKPQYDLWENPAHIRNQHPVPPPYAAGHTHTIVRHTHSSSSSSSCNSRRVVRCRARLSKCSGGSGSEPGQLIREEMCVTEQVERMVEVEQNGDTHVEVCRVSRCNEVVALDSNLRPLSGKSGEDGLMMEDEEKQPMSIVSSSSHVLQFLKEDQDDDLPPSASQCSCRNEPSPTSETGPVHSCQSKHHYQVESESRAGFHTAGSRCRAPSPHSTAEINETQTFRHTTSRASCRSDDEEEEIMRVASSLSGHTDGSLQSSLCPHCGGFKRPVDSVPNSRSSRRSRHSQNDDDDDDNDDDDVVSNVSAVSTKSNRTNLSNHITQSRACSAISNPETRDEERTSVRSRRSNTSHKSGCNGPTGLSEDHAGERSPSALSAQSTKSRNSSNNGATEHTDVRKKVEELGDNDRALSPWSAKTGASSKTNPSVKLYINDASQSDSATGEDGTTDNRPASVKSTVSVKTNQSQRSNCNRGTAAVSPCADEAASDKLQEESKETEERAPSTNSRPPSKATERSISPGSNPEDNSRSMSKMSGKSVQSKASVKSSKSHRSSCNVIQTATTLNVTEGEDKEEEEEAIEEQKQRAESVASSAKSAGNQGPTSEGRDTTENDEDQEKAEITSLEKRAHSAMSGNSNSTAKSSSPQKSNCSSPVDPKNEDELERATSAMSAISKSSAKSSHKSGKTCAASVSSQKSSPNGATDAETADADHCISPKSARSQKINSSKVSRPPSSNPRSPVRQLLPGSRGPSALSVHSVKSAKSARSKCSCGAASSNKEMEEEEDNDVRSEELSEQPANVLSPVSTKRMRKESGGTEELLSRNSSGSISIALPEDTASSDSWKSSVSGRNRVKTRSPDAAVGKDADELSESVVSQKSNFNENKSTRDLPIINIDTPKTPGQSQESGEQNSGRASSAVTSKSSRSRKSCHCSVKSGSLRSKGSGVEEQDDGTLSTASSARAQVKHVSKTPEGDSVKNVSRPTSKAKKKEDIDDNKASSIPSKSPCCLSPDVADSVKCRKATSDGSVKSSRSKKKVEPTKSSSPCPAANTSPASKSETCSGSTLSQSLSAADMLKESVVAPSGHQSKTSKTSRAPRSARHQEKQNETASGDLELTPTCLPNASPNEVVSEWLRGIPADSSMLGFSDDLRVEEEEQEKVEENPVKEAAEGERPEGKTLDEEDKSKQGEEEEEEELKAEGAAGDTAVASQPNTPLMSTESVPRNWQSSAAVMKVLLSSSLGRCQSLPEVSPVYGRRLSTSAQGFLDCLAQLQLIEPAVHPSCDPQKGHRYEDIMTILQSLWLIEPRDIEAKEDKGIGTDQVTPPRSSSGVDMNSGSGGSGKETGNQGGDETVQNQTCDAVSMHAEEQAASTEQDPVPASLDSPKVTENPSIEQCSHEDSSKSPTDNERETPEVPSMGSPPALAQTLARKPSQDPDPVWILKLLQKLEKQFMNHYVTAMAEFKVRWDLDDSVILNTMMTELRDEVSQRIQSSIAREMKKIQSRTGRAERSARPPREPNTSRDSSMTERRRRMMKVLKNQSIKTADSVTDEEMTGDFSEQRSEDEYCPCDACVRKKMAARPLITNPAAAEAPVMMEFDLLKILQLKKGPLPSSTPAKEEEEGEEEVLKEEGSSLEAVQEEEEEVEESKEDINADVTLKETILEENEEGEDGSEGEEEEEEVEEAQRECQCAKDETEENVQEGEGENDAGEDESADDEEESEQETVKEARRGETANIEEEAAEECEREEEKGESVGRESAEGENTENEVTSEEVTQRQASEAQDEEDDSREGESHEEARGRGSDEREASEEETHASQGLEVAKAEEADDTGHPSDAEADQSREVEMEDEDAHEKQEEENSEKEDGVLHHQFSRTSVESQPGSLEDINAAANPVSSIEVPKTDAGGGGGGGVGGSVGQRRSRSPARVKRRKPKECNEEDF